MQEEKNKIVLPPPNDVTQKTLCPFYTLCCLYVPLPRMPVCSWGGGWWFSQQESALQADALPLSHQGASRQSTALWQRERKWSRPVVSDSLRPHGLQPARLPCPWNFPGKNTRVDWHFLLQGLFWTQGSNLCLLPCRQILYCLVASHLCQC